MVSFNGIPIAVILGDGAFRTLNALDGEQFPKEARDTSLGLSYGIDTSAKIFGPLTMRATIGGGAVQQEVTLQAVFLAFILFVALFFVGGAPYLFAKGTKGASLEGI